MLKFHISQRLHKKQSIGKCKVKRNKTVKLKLTKIIKKNKLLMILLHHLVTINLSKSHLMNKNKALKFRVRK